jgi:hypothetical protein
MNTIRHITSLLLLMLLTVTSCQKEEYSFGELRNPTDLTLTAVVVGVDANNPNGDGSGQVTITATSKGALTYQMDFGDGVTRVVPSGTVTYKYNNPGTSTFTINVNAVGTGGSLSTISKRVTVFVAFNIPADIVSSLTGTGSKVWVTDKEAPGHFGVGPNNEFAPIWYAAVPNTREACAYDDEITFSKDAAGRIFMSIDNKGASFSIGASTGFYGFSGGDGCYPMSTGGNKQLVFMNATSGSTSAVSTQIQFMVPGNGIINFGTGGVTYEILSITPTSIHLRNIGSDNNSWYQKLTPKP